MSGRYPAKDRTAIAGIGLSPYSRDRGQITELTLVLEACVAAIRDAGLSASDIDGVVGGGYLTGGIDPMVVSTAIGVKGLTYWAPAKPPIMNHLMAAVNAVHSGAADTVLVYHAAYRAGFSRSAGSDPFRRRALFGTGDGRNMTGEGHTDVEPWGMFGSTGYAAWAARYLADFGASREDLGLIAINDRSNAALNDNAVMRTALTMDDYLGARMIREPLCLLDMDVPIDGADAFVVTTTERARDLPQRPALIHAASMGLAAHPEEHLTTSWDHTGQAIVAADLAAKSDYRAQDADIFFPYDGFTIVALRCFESFGFCGPGEAGDFLRSHWDKDAGRVLIDGRVPVNPHGGSLSEGGTQGAGHVREAVLQLRGDAGPRQVADARLAWLTPGGFFFNAQGLVLRTE